MASFILKGAPSDDPDKPRRLPKVAVYVAGATFAVTTGLTLLVLPYIRQAARLAAPTTQFLSNRNLLREPGPSIPKPLALDVGDVSVRRSRGFNDREERELYGSQSEDGEAQPVGGLMGLQALGIATALVFGSAGLGAWVVSKLLGVKNMDEFAAKMRETMQLRMPGLAEAVHGNNEDGHGSSDGDADLASVERAADIWLRELSGSDRLNSVSQPAHTPS